MKFRSGRSSRITGSLVGWNALSDNSSTSCCNSMQRASVPVSSAQADAENKPATANTTIRSNFITLFPFMAFVSPSSPARPRQGSPVPSRAVFEPNEGGKIIALRRNTAARTLRACRPSGCRGTPSTGEHPPLHLRWRSRCSVRPTAPVCLRPSPAVAGRGVAGEMGHPLLWAPFAATRVGVPSGSDLTSGSAIWQRRRFQVRARTPASRVPAGSLGVSVHRMARLGRPEAHLNSTRRG